MTNPDRTRVKMPISTALLREILRLPTNAEILDVEKDPFRAEVDLIVDVDGAPDGAVTMVPVWQRSQGWPDPVHLCGITWYGEDGKPIGAGEGSDG